MWHELYTLVKPCSHKMECELRVLEKNNIRAFYRCVNKRLHNHADISPLYDADGHTVCDSLSKAELLNEYFVSVCTTDDGVIPLMAKPTCCERKLDSILFTPKNVGDAIYRLKITYRLVLMKYHQCFINKLLEHYQCICHNLHTTNVGIGST